MYGFKILCEISKVPFEISHKMVNPYPTKYAFFEVFRILQFMICYSYDSLSISETGSRDAKMSRVYYSCIKYPTAVDA